MTDLNVLANEIAKYCLEGRLTFLLGAGIDMSRRSNVPGWDALMGELLKILGKEASPDQIKYVAEYRSHLMNEVLLQKLSQNLSDTTGRDQATDLVRNCVDTKEFSPIHRFLAWAIQDLGTGVLTTNYNYLIEYAAEQRTLDMGSKPLNDNLLVKLHGELRKPESMRHKVDSVYAPLNDEITDRAAPLLKNKILLVVGYRGADEFDVIPLIFEQHKPFDIIWLVHPSAKDREPDELVREKLKRSPIVADADYILQRVYNKVIELGGPEDKSLRGDWALATGGDADWWKKNLHDWGEMVWTSYQDDMRFLWACIAEHVRAYFVEQAYQRFLDGSPDTYRRLFAQAHVAYQLRTRGKTDIKLFQNTLLEIRSTLSPAKMTLDSNTRGKIEELCGWTLHEFGIALQNSWRYFDAKLILQEATTQRVLRGDVSTSYSIFQAFMNGFQAQQKGLSIDDFAPLGWRTWLLSELDRYAKIFRQANSAEHHANTVHNMAFVHQAMAIEHEKEKRTDDAEKEFASACELNKTAYNVRMRLRDPRMMAQSQVRIAQCTLGVARAKCIQGNVDQARNYIDEAKKLMGETEEIYRRVPQEDIRKQDVENITLDINKIERELKVLK